MCRNGASRSESVREPSRSMPDPTTRAGRGRAQEADAAHRERPSPGVLRLERVLRAGRTRHTCARFFIRDFFERRSTFGSRQGWQESTCSGHRGIAAVDAAVPGRSSRHRGHLAVSGKRALSRHAREAVVADRAANAAVGGQPPLVTTAKREADNAQAFDQRARAGQTTPQQGMAGSSQRREASE
jgi:hypothetical protein